jgi:outer membrane protein TolC
MEFHMTFFTQALMVGAALALVTPDLALRAATPAWPQGGAIRLDSLMAWALASSREIQASIASAEAIASDTLAAYTFGESDLDADWLKSFEKGVGPKGGIRLNQAMRFGYADPVKRKGRKVGQAHAARLQAERQEVSALVMAFWIEAQAARDRLGLAQKQLRLSEETVTRLQSGMARGTVSELEVNTVRLDAAAKAQHVQDAHLEAAGLLARLKALLAPTNTPFHAHVPALQDSLLENLDFAGSQDFMRHLLAGNLGEAAFQPALPESVWVSQAQRQSPTLVALRQELEAARIDAEVQKALQRPEIAVSAIYDRESSGENHFGAGISVPLNWQLRNADGIAKAKAEIQTARLTLEKAENQLALAIRQARREWLTAAAALTALDSVQLPLLQRQVALAEGAFQQGRLDGLEWLRWSQAAAQAAQERVTAWVRLESAKLHLALLAGHLEPFSSQPTRSQP